VYADISAKDTAVNEAKTMEGFQTSGHLNKNPPNVILFKGGFIFLMIHDFLINVAI